MLLNQLIETQNARYNDLQAQIEALQEEQRQIQTYLQTLGSIESKMISAAAMVEEAVNELNQHAPDELDGYQETINSLFKVAIASLPQPTAPTDTEAPQPTEPTPPTETQNPETTAIIDITPPENWSSEDLDRWEDIPSEQEILDNEPPLDTMDHLKLELSHRTCKELRKTLRELRLSDKGKKQILIERLMNHYHADLDNSYPMAA